jgi:hypothetical protein
MNNFQQLSFRFLFLLLTWMTLLDEIASKIQCCHDATFFWFSGKEVGEHIELQ